MSKVFNRVNGILLAGFLGGVLVAGLGCGIAWGEYSSFEYDDALLAEEQLTVDEYIYDMAAEEAVIVPAANAIIADESVASGTLLIQTEYNPLAIQLQTNVYESDMQANAQASGATVIEMWGHYIRDDFDLFLENKDVVLQGLKEGKFVRLASDYHFEVKVTCNPADAGRVFADFDSAAAGMGHGHLREAGN